MYVHISILEWTRAYTCTVKRDRPKWLRNLCTETFVRNPMGRFRSSREYSRFHRQYDLF